MPESDLTNLRIDAAAGLPEAAEGAIAFTDLFGSWEVRRVIVDHLSGAVHRFEGTVVIDATAFIETGHVRYGAVSLKADRRYALDGGEDAVAVAFADDRPFIRLDRQARQAVQHLCGADDYRGRFFFRDRDNWVETWRVSGPRKRYASLARYRRQTP